jgi:hypothetical protein
MLKCNSIVLFQRGAFHSLHRLSTVAPAQRRRPLHDADRGQVHGHGKHFCNLSQKLISFKTSNETC